MGQRWHRITRDAWLFATAGVATLGAVTVVAVQWLAHLGVVRECRVNGSGTAIPAGFFTTTARTFEWHPELGLAPGGPSWRLTQLYAMAWAFGSIAGLLWMLRVALRADAYRIGASRGFGVLSRFGLFVVTGAMHRVMARSHSPS